MQFEIIRKVQVVSALQKNFLVARLPLIFVFRAIKQQEQRNSNSPLWFLV